jgi:hypothetical protein
MHDIFEHWDWTTPQLKFLVCIKLTTALSSNKQEGDHHPGVVAAP